MKDFRNLKVWEKRYQLTLEIYKATRTFPTDEKYGIVSQIRRSSSSIPTNISEGCGRQGDAEFTRFLQIAMGSACETEYLILLAKDVGYLSDDKHQSLIDLVSEVKRMLSSFIVTLREQG